MLEEVEKELSSTVLSVGVDDAINNLNEALEAGGYSLRVESISFTDSLEARNCRCLSRGITGYTERCVTRNGVRSCVKTPTYGCTSWDCT